LWLWLNRLYILCWLYYNSLLRLLIVLRNVLTLYWLGHLLRLNWNPLLGRLIVIISLTLSGILTRILILLHHLLVYILLLLFLAGVLALYSNTTLIHHLIIIFLFYLLLILIIVRHLDYLLIHFTLIILK
jgi:hypothetical protein